MRIRVTILKLYALSFFTIAISCQNRRAEFSSFCNSSNNPDFHFLADKIEFNTLYKKDKIVDSTSSDNVFVQTENDYIKNKTIGYKFLSNGKLEYYHSQKNNLSINKASIGCYKAYKDSIVIFREFFSAQGGKYYSKKRIIIKDSILIESGYGKDNIYIIYSKKS